MENFNFAMNVKPWVPVSIPHLRKPDYRVVLYKGKAFEFTPYGAKRITKGAFQATLLIYGYALSLINCAAWCVRG